MSDLAGFALQRQPKGRPTLTYEGPDVIQNRDGVVQLKVRSDRVFEGEHGCTESCELIKASLPSGQRLALDKLIKKGELKGTFDPNGGVTSLWFFNLKFYPFAATTRAQRRRAQLDGSYQITHLIELKFRHTAVEHIPKACTPGRETSPCDQALVEEQTFTYESELNAYLTLIHRIDIRNVEAQRH
jgi:hypothetical protein